MAGCWRGASVPFTCGIRRVSRSCSAVGSGFSRIQQFTRRCRMPTNELVRFLNEWERESESTLKLLRALPDTQYDFRPDPDPRESVGVYHCARDPSSRPTEPDVPPGRRPDARVVRAEP